MTFVVILVGCSIALSAVIGLFVAVARFLFRAPIEFDQNEMLPTDWEKRT